MSLALFRSTLRSAVREAQAADPALSDRDLRQAPREAELLRRVARGELTAQQALETLKGTR
jgi:DNA-binding CsgD family transcriptional regulator